MSKNTKILYCLLGSAILALLNCPILKNSSFGIFENAHGVLGATLFQITNLIINILSLSGFMLLIMFSIILIKKNIFKEK